MFFHISNSDVSVINVPVIQKHNLLTDSWHVVELIVQNVADDARHLCAKYWSIICDI